MKTLFLKSNLLHLLTNEGEFEVSNPEACKNFLDELESPRTPVEWPYGVELIKQYKHREGWSDEPTARDTIGTVFVRLLPKEQDKSKSFADSIASSITTINTSKAIFDKEKKKEFKPAQPTPNFPKGGTTFTESAYICPIDNKPCYMSNCIHSDEYPALCGNKKERSESAYKEFEGNCSKCGHPLNPATAGYQCTNINCPAVESTEPQEKMSYWQYQQFAEAAITQLKDRNEKLESENKALREELLTTEKALQEINNQHQEDYKRLKSALEEIERLKAEVLKEKFPEN